LSKADGRKANWMLKSQRDLTLQIPLNYVTYPGIDISRACFGNNIFENDSAILCFSNLLATGFRRFILDLYWDDGRRVWSLCPVQLPILSTNTGGSSSTDDSFTSSSVTVSSAQITPRSNPHLSTISISVSTIFSTSVAKVVNRQATPTNPNVGVGTASSTLETSTTGRNTTTATANGQSSTSSGVSSSTTGLIVTGPYSCSTSIDFPVLTAVLADYMKNSSDTLHAYIMYITLNLHAARPSSTPMSAGILGNTSLFPPSQLISNLLNVNLSSYLYTPTLLREERANLNASNSWYGTSADGVFPEAAYLNTTRDGRGQLSTENGWPTANFLEFTNRANRILVGFGLTDPQVAYYNATGDEDTVFPVNAFESTDLVEYDTSGEVQKGCYFNSNNSSISNANNTWAVSTQLQSSSEIEYSVSNLTACGISPILNVTLLNITADTNITPYQSFAYSSIWSWLPGEPRIISSTTANSARLRCSVLDGSANGRWRVTDCTEHHYAACQVGDEPYLWRLSSSKAVYSSGDTICPAGSSFAVPRTALENQHLLSAVSQRSGDAVKDPTVWLNFNSLDTEGCWVYGVNSICPYRSAAADNTRRAVIVPTVAAVIVFVIAALTVFIKCAANRQKSRRGRRRRRADDGWDYEGVPS
jgi:hypothetical protein